MEVIRKFIDASRLMTVMSLPEAFQNRRLEVIVLPADEAVPACQKSAVPQIVQSLVGAVPDPGLSLSELRAERLEKYEAPD